LDSVICLSQSCPESALDALQLVRLFIAAFLAILFLQSGIDKVVDRAGNIEWLTGHFAKTPFKNVVPLMVTQITVMELGAGALCAVGGIMLLLGGGTSVATVGVALAALSLIGLFLGQRIAKDYEGAAVLVNYFVLTILGLYVLAL